MIIDCNMHHLPEDLFTNEKVMQGFLTTAPRGFGEIASLETICEMMGRTPAWANGLLLRADGFVCDFYKKD